jgi:NADPH:quinone reductase-like Zn-dependent oxidoreductase
MQALLLEHFGGAGAMHVGEMEIPEPARGEVLVRVLAAGWGRGTSSSAAADGGARCPMSPARSSPALSSTTPAPVRDSRTARQSTGGPGPGGCYAQYVTCHVERLAPVLAGLRVTDSAAVLVGALTVD